MKYRGKRRRRRRRLVHCQVSHEGHVMYEFEKMIAQQQGSTTNGWILTQFVFTLRSGSYAPQSTKKSCHFPNLLNDRHVRFVYLRTTRQVDRLSRRYIVDGNANKSFDGGANPTYMMNATQSMVGNHDDSQCPTLLHRAHFACEMVG